MVSSTVLMALCWTYTVLHCAGANVTLPEGKFPIIGTAPMRHYCFCSHFGACYIMTNRC